MAYVPVPKDLNAVKTKVMFNLTKRQLVCFGCGLAIALPLFFLCKSTLNTSVASIVLILKLCTYPRTDSRYLTDDMLDGVEAIVDCAAGISGEGKPVTVHAKQVCNGKKVSDHHAIIPTMVAGKTDLGTLPAGEREVLTMIAKQVLRAVSGACKFCETNAELVEGVRLWLNTRSKIPKQGSKTSQTA